MSDKKWDKIYKSVEDLLYDLGRIDADWFSEDILKHWNNIDSYLRIDIDEDDDIDSIIKKIIEYADKKLKEDWTSFGFDRDDVDDLRREFHVPDEKWEEFKTEELPDYFYDVYVPSFLKHLKRYLKEELQKKRFRE
jgi:hypothetical protein